MNIGFQEGQIVKAGDFLAQIDPRPYQATLAQAQAQLTKDTAAYHQAQTDLARYQTLNRQDSIAKQQVDDQVFLVAQDKAAIGVDQAQIEAAKLNINYTHITSPIDGRVGLRLVDPGNFVQPNDTNGIVTITQLDPISVVFSIPEDHWQQVQKPLLAGKKLPVTLYDRANIKHLAQGWLTAYDNQVDTTTGTFKLRAQFPNSENLLFPNQFVNVQLRVDTLQNVVLIPNAALQTGQNGSFVYAVVDNTRVEMRPVTSGPSDEAHTLITQGLDAGEDVVIDGVDRLRDGAQVRALEANKAP